MVRARFTWLLPGPPDSLALPCLAPWLELPPRPVHSALTILRSCGTHSAFPCGLCQARGATSLPLRWVLLEPHSSAGETEAQSRDSPVGPSWSLASRSPSTPFLGAGRLSAPHWASTQPVRGAWHPPTGGRQGGWAGGDPHSLQASRYPEG